MQLNIIMWTLLLCCGGKIVVIFHLVEAQVPVVFKICVMLRLRVKTREGGQVALTERVRGDSTLEDLSAAIHDVTAIPPHRQKILIGFPPKSVTGRQEASLTSLGIGNGEVIIVEEVDQLSLPMTGRQQDSAAPTLSARLSDSPVSNNSIPQGILLKKVVPSDNSCLFASIYYLINGGEIVGSQQVEEMRTVVAAAVKSQPDLYSEAVLERSNSNYCDWILKDTSWGGAIELSIFSQYYEIEMVALDSKTGNLNRFGEDKKYDYRMIVMYDGIHYDPIYMETYEGNKVYIFPVSAESVLQQAQEMVLEAKQSGQFTDTHAFQLECKECGHIMTGEEAAVTHAKTTGHSKFDEVRK
ncbi:hypothetical protein Pcinc_009642 [Petrolisthes cinctipes]|uniref:Ubiquitin thioesterase OTU n=1 Tax=Petrolisthes cinctipes TaxID=88211 RepID=A0AAE1G4K1_PETCI|nr:hypothetical protein Pcinc_009642 [Petrolisthes cinctipes]